MIATSDSRAAEPPDARQAGLHRRQVPGDDEPAAA